MDLQNGPRLGLCIAILIGIVLCGAPAVAQVPGANVNMVSGTDWPGGDPFLQRQNEPSLAVSSRNPFHMLAGANDYRSVDLARTTNGETGDAWLGLFKSLDGGNTWRSILLPGCPYNTPVCAGAPAVKNAGFQAAADPTVRAGTNGMFYYAGLVFNRGLNPQSGIIVSRFIDLNNKENADPADILNGDAIQFIDTSVVARGTASLFLDKPALAVDVPRVGASTCNLSVNQPGNGTVHQSFLAGNVYVAYAGFAEPPNTDPEAVTSPLPSKIYLVRSTNCGATWSQPKGISGAGIENQGAVIAINPITGGIFVAWRQFRSQSGNTVQPDAIMGVTSNDGGQTFSAPVQISTFTPFDEGTTNTSFRTNAFPTAAFDARNRVYVAYSARNTIPSGDARVVVTSSLGGALWTKPMLVDNPPVDPLNNPTGRGHQIMPALTFAAGRLSLLYYDLRLDHTFGVFTPLMSGGQPTGLYADTPAFAGELGLSPPLVGAVFNSFIDDSTTGLRRHTFDLRVSQGIPGAVPVFSPSVLVSQYAYGCCTGNQTDIEQLEFNAPNLPLFKSGTAPFMGDYVDLAPAPLIIPPQITPLNDGNADSDDWAFNISPTFPTTWHAVWTDNRDVQAPADGDWTHYTPPNSPSLGANSIFDPASSTPTCQPGFTGSRNQNIYTAPISGGLIFGAPANSKPLGTTVFNGKAVPFQRAFSLVAQNATNLIKSYRLTIANQPPGGNASFLQFSQLTTLDLSIPPLSSATRPVFVSSTSTTASVTVTIAEISAPGGTLVSGGLSSSTMLNPDPTNPAITNPAITNPAITNPAITNFEVTNPAITNPAITNPAITNPAITNPAITNPAITNATLQNVSVVNPAITNPAITNPAITNASIANPAITNPAITNVNPASTSITDTQWTISNNGNTEGSFTVNLASSSNPTANNVLQLIISKLYQTPAAPTGQSCNLSVETHNTIVTNIVRPTLFQPTDPAITNPAITNPAITNATVALAPGETANIIVRVVNTDITQPTFNPATSVAPVAVAQAVDTQTALSVPPGGTPPPPTATVPPLSIATATLPDAVSGRVYSSTIQTTGGNPTAHTFSITSGGLPAGLSLNAATGAITGPVTAVGPASFSFTVQVQDVGSTSFPQHTATQSLTIRVGAPLLFSPQTLPQATQGTTYRQTISITGGIGTILQNIVSGNLPPGLGLNTATGLISGIPTATGPFSFTVQAADSANPPQTAAQSYTINVVSVAQTAANVVFLTQPANSIGGQVLSGNPIIVQVTDASGAVIPNANVTMSFSGAPPCSAATLTGTLTQTTTATGQASFPDLSIDRGQLGYRLQASVGNISAASNPFTVNGFCTTGSLPAAVRFSSATLLPNGKVLVAGGVTSTGNILNTTELYDSSTNIFTATGNMGIPREFHSATLLRNGLVLIAGGVSNSGFQASAELYDPSTGAFTPTNAMNVPRGFHTATLLADGKVLIAGGENNGVSLQTAELYDPATGLFSLTSSMTTARRQQTATLLPDGTVLLTGGADANLSAVSTAELYDPVQGAFFATGGMASPRIAHAAMLLSSGKVLVAGGFLTTTSSATTTSAELYDPSTHTFSPTGSLSAANPNLALAALADGNALISGNQFAQVYDQIQGAFVATGAPTITELGNTTVVLNNGSVLDAGGDFTDPSAEVYYSVAPLAPMQIATTALAPAATGKPFTQVLLQQGGVGNLTWTVTGTLPAGLTFTNQGILIGTPTVAGSFPLTFSLTDSSTPAKTATASLTLTVTNSQLAFTSNTVPTAVAGRPYTQVLPVAGGTQPYSSTITAGTLPPGMAVAGNLLTGTPSGSGNFTFTVSVTDSSSPAQAASQTLTISVNTLVITTATLPNGIVGVPYNASINTGGGTLPLFFSLTTAAFPPGLLIQQPASGSSSGALAGTPTLAGTYTFSESVADSSNPQQTATQNYVVTIAPAGSAVPANVIFVTQPQTSVGGKTLSGGPIVVRVTDAANNPIPNTTVAMTLTGIFGTPLSCPVATLTGGLSAVTDGAGQATFSNLSIDRGGFNYSLLASTGSASRGSGPFSVQGFCGSANMSTQREGHTQDVLGTRNTRKFPLDPAGTYLFTNTNPAAGGTPDNPHPPLIISLAQFNVKPGDIISGVSVGDENACGFAGEPCFGEIFQPFTCAVFSSSSTLLPPGGAINRVPGAIAPDFTTAFPCNTGNTGFGGLPTDIPQDFALLGERVTVPPGAQFLFVGVSDVFFADNVDPNGDLGVAFTLNSTTSANSKILIAGGVDNLGNALSTAELYDPALNFTQPAGNLTTPNGRFNHVSVVLLDGRVLLIGGSDNSGANLATAEIYDPETGTFSATGSMAQPRGLPAATLLADGRVLVTGGVDGGAVLATAEIFDPNTGLFTPTGSMNQRRTRHATTLLPNGKVLVTGGRDAAVNFFALANAEIFDPYANGRVGAFTPLPNMSSPRFKHTSTLLTNGTVLIAGGFNGDNTSPSVASAEIFDFKTNTFAPTASMNTPRARHAATELPDGTVLMTGGIDAFNGIAPAAPAELYFPGTGTFSLTGSMITGREISAASLLLPNGNVLVSGGDNGVDVLPTTETYFNTIPQAPIIITTASLPNGVISQPYVQLLLSQNKTGPIFWSLASGTLPPGINLIVNGTLIGTPTAAGSFTFTIQVTDGISTASATFTIIVNGAPLNFGAQSLPTAIVGSPYTPSLVTSGGTPPLSFAVTSGTPPAGINLGASGTFSGAPTAAGTSTFTVTVTDSSSPQQSASQSVTIQIASPLAITTTSLPSGTLGAAYNSILSSTGGLPPVSFAVTSGTSPPGLTLASNGPQSASLSGTPTATGTFTFTVTATDSSTPPQTASQTYAVTIAPLVAPSLVSINPNSAYQGQQSLSVAITGQATNFTQGTTVADFGTGVHVQSLTVASPTSATAVVNVDGAPNANVALNFFPNSVYNPNTATMDAALGTTGFTIDDFETTTLIPGLTIQLTGGVPTTTWTSLPNLFNGDICPGLDSGQAWDGTDTATNLISNQVSNCSGPSGAANLTTFNYAPGATSFGIGFSNFQSANPPSPQFPVTNHELFVNGVDMGVLETLAGAAWSPGLTRNAYLRIDGVNGGVITSVAIANLDSSQAVDALMFDHLAVLPSATPATRDVKMTTNAEVATLPGGFTVTTKPSPQAITLTSDGPLLGVGRSFNATAVLNQPAPIGGVVVTLVSSDATVATVSPATFTIPAGAVSATFTLTGVNPGTVTLTASAPNFTNGTASLTVTASLISLQSGALVVAPGQSSSLAVSLSSPAGPGGVTINFVSADPTVATITPSTFVPQGAQTGATNPQVTGIAIGSTFITASAIGFAQDTSIVQVTVAASFNPSNFNVPATRTNNILLDISAAAPQPSGITFSLSSDNTNFATVPQTATIPAGQVSVSVPVTGVAQGTAHISASASGIATASATINVGAAPSLTINVTTTIGKDLQLDNQSISLGAVSPANEALTLTSNSPNLLIANSPSGPFSQSITLQLSLNSPSVPVFSMQSLASTGSGQLTASAAGFSNGNVTVNFTPSGIIWFNSNFSTTTFSADTTLTLLATQLNPNTLGVQSFQNVRTGAAVSVTVTSSDTTVGTIVSSPVAFTTDTNSATVAFHPIAPGTANLVIITPAGFSTPTGVNATSITATVSAPSITVNAVTNLGQNLQVDNQSISLGAPPPSNRSLTLTSNSPNLLIANGPAGPFSQSITLQLLQGSLSVPIFSVQSLAGTGTGQLTASASGYNNGVDTVNLTPSGIEWFSGPFNTTTFSPDTNLTLVAAQLNPNTLVVQSFQNVRTGFSLSVTVTSSDTTVGTIVTSPVAFATDTNTANAKFHPLAAGPTNLVITTPAGFSVPSGVNATSIAVNVSAPGISVNATANLGQNLQMDNQSISLAAPPPTSRTLTLVSNSPNLLLANSAAGPFSQSISLQLTGGSSAVGTFSMQSLASTGTAQLTASAPGYNDGVDTVNLTPSGIEWFNGPFSTTTFSADTTLTLIAAQLAPGTLNLQSFQNIRTGLTLSVTVTSSDPTIGTIVTSPVTFAADTNSIATKFHPLTAGTTNLVITTPAGFTAPPGVNTTSIAATVSAPNLSINAPANLGQNLQVDNQSISLGAAPPNNETLTLTSSSANVLLANSPAGPFSPSITLQLTKASTSVPAFSVQALGSIGSAQLTAQAPGYTDGVLLLNVTPSGIMWFSGSFGTTTFSADATLTLISAQLNPNTLALQSFQNIRTGLSVTVTLTSSDISIGTIVSPVTIAPDTSSITTKFHPVGTGTANLVITTPAGFTAPTGFNTTSITATVTAPNISINVTTNLGQNLQLDNQSIGIGAAPPTSRSLILTSNSPNLLIADNPAGPFSQSVTLLLTAGSSAVPNFSVQSLAGSGTGQLTASAPGYNSDTLSINLTPSGIIWFSGSFNTTTSSANTTLTLFAAQLNPSTLTVQSFQNVRTGLSVAVTVTSSDTSVGTIVASPVTVAADTNNTIVTFHPVAAGTASLVIATPTGFSTPNPPSATSITATVQ